MSTFAVIPARGGSKRIPEKVLQKVGNQTLLERTIGVCQESGIFDKILVSTDSAKVAKVAEQKGVRVPFLRDRFADDFSPVSSATAYTLETYREINGQLGEGVVVQAMPTCPFLTSKTITDFYVNYLSLHQVDSLISCTKASPLVRFGFELMEGGLPAYLDKKLDPISRTQDYPPVFLPSGALWMSSITNILKTKSFYSGSVQFCEISFWEGFDIDTPEELELAQALASTRE